MQMATVMMSTTMQPAFLMEEIVVDLMSTHNTAQNANVLEVVVSSHHLGFLEIMKTGLTGHG